MVYSYHMKLFMRYFKRTISMILTIVSIFILFQSNITYADLSNWSWSRTHTNNGMSSASSNNGYVGVDGNWGASSVVWEHQKQYQASDTFYYAKERIISLPRAISSNEDININFFAAGYAHSYTDSRTDTTTKVNVRVYYRMSGFFNLV